MTTDQLSAETFAHVLDEPEVALLAQMFPVLGSKRTVDALAEALMVEANGGMRTKDGTRRRTKGGVFLYLVRGRVSPRERQQLFPRPSRPQNARAPQ
jgi:phosphorylated adapter RNA export protein